MCRGVCPPLVEISSIIFDQVNIYADIFIRWEAWEALTIIQCLYITQLFYFSNIFEK